MSPVALVLLAVGVLGAFLIIKGAKKLYRQGVIEDEAAERKRLAEEAALAEEIEKSFPGVSAKLNEDKVRNFSSRK